jgi:hypothetical protein
LSNDFLRKEPPGLPKLIVAAQASIPSHSGGTCLLMLRVNFGNFREIGNLDSSSTGQTGQLNQAS